METVAAYDLHLNVSMYVRMYVSSIGIKKLCLINAMPFASTYVRIRVCVCGEMA